MTEPSITTIYPEVTADTLRASLHWLYRDRGPDIYIFPAVLYDALKPRPWWKQLLSPRKTH